MQESEIKARVLALFDQPHLVVVLSTVDDQGHPRSRFMGAVVPVEGVEFAWYFETMRESRKVGQLGKRPHAQVLAARADYSEVAALSGRAALVDDDTVKKQGWDAVPASAEYFTGWDSPEFAVLRFDAESLEYLNLTVRLEPFAVNL